MSSRRILVIDDSETDRSVYRRFLGRPIGPETFSVQEATSGVEARELYASAEFDCVVMDYYLPDTNGLELLRELRALGRLETLCVVMITGTGNERVAVTALNNGAFDYLVKGQFDAEELYKTVVHAIERNEARRRLSQYHEELQEANAELARTNDQLTRANVDLDSFVYTASHDLRAPIVNIEGLVDALSEEITEAGLARPDIAQLLDLLHDSVGRFKKVIDDLAEVIQVQRTDKLATTCVGLDNVIHDVLLDLGPQIQESGAQVDVDLDDCREVRFSERHLRSVVYNLISNALKYRDPARPLRVQVRCVRAGEFAELSVADNGLGIDLTSGRPLFGLFTRHHLHVEGSGIGLYMVKRLVENAGGRVDVTSMVGTGTTFRIYFRR